MAEEQADKAVCAGEPGMHTDETTGLAQSIDFPNRRPWLPAAVLVALGAASLTVDLPVSHWATTTVLPGSVRKLIEIGETFGHGIGVLLIVAAAYSLDPGRRWALPRLLAVTYGSGLAANLAKFVFVRTRPRGFDLATTDVWLTFQGWLPPWQRASVNESFPSAHTATAVAFAVALACLYPQARRFLFGLAALVGLQRVVSGAHYLSDVCCGAAVGWLAACAILSLPGSVAWRERLRGQTSAADGNGVPSLFSPDLAAAAVEDRASAA
ncbi:MAG TPA: phosphatase PAP2 family protein [Pirellulales bacterium]|nr:phosphatase PAP2 family protein [Pirellulales bacterium]